MLEALQSFGLCPVPQIYIGYGTGVLMLRPSWLLQCFCGPWSVWIDRVGVALTG